MAIAVPAPPDPAPDSATGSTDHAVLPSPSRRPASKEHSAPRPPLRKRLIVSIASSAAELLKLTPKALPRTPRVPRCSWPPGISAKSGSTPNRRRLAESFYYIAEILNRFDLIAVQVTHLEALESRHQELGLVELCCHSLTPSSPLEHQCLASTTAAGELYRMLRDRAAAEERNTRAAVCHALRFQLGAGPALRCAPCTFTMRWYSP